MKHNINAEKVYKALDDFYNSKTYRLIAEGVSAMSDEYLVKELQNENI